MLVSLDKRTVIWEQLSQKETSNNRPLNFVKSASVGDLVVRFASIKQEKNNMIQSRVVAFTQKGHVYRITLSAHRGISVEQIYSNATPNEIVVVSSIGSIEEDSVFEIVYGTEDGRVKMVSQTNSSNAVEQR